MHFSVVILLTSLLLRASALVVPPSNSTSNSTSKFSARTVFQFPQGYWLENLAARANGQVLTTTYTPSAGLYLIDPTPNASYPAVRVHHFENSTSALGIVEAADTEPDTFYVATLNFSASDGFVPHTSQIWRVDMSSFHYSARSGQVSGAADVSHVTSLSAVGMANGMSLLRPDSSNILIADSLEGAIWKLDTATGHYDLSSSFSAMRSNNPARKFLGIDGIQVHRDTLYFNNAGEFTFASMPIHANGTAKSEPVVMATDLKSDGFCLYDADTALVTMNIDNGLAAIDLESNRRWMVAGNTPNSVFVTPTSVELGREENASRLAYVTMGGTYVATSTENLIGGRLVMVDLKSTVIDPEGMGRSRLLGQEADISRFEL